MCLSQEALGRRGPERHVPRLCGVQLVVRAQARIVVALDVLSRCQRGLVSNLGWCQGRHPVLHPCAPSYSVFRYVATAPSEARNQRAHVSALFVSLLCLSHGLIFLIRRSLEDTNCLSVPGRHAPPRTNPDTRRQIKARSTPAAPTVCTGCRAVSGAIDRFSSSGTPRKVKASLPAAVSVSGSQS